MPVLFDPGKDDRRLRSLWSSLDDARLSESVVRAHVYYCPYLGIYGQVIICVKKGSAVHIFQVLRVFVQIYRKAMYRNPKQPVQAGARFAAV